MRAAMLALVVLVLVPAGSSASSLYTGPGSRPGPAILYAPPGPTPPQLQNTGIWHAKPILVSGASAYRGGEFVYQDFLFDDHGPLEQRDPNDPRFPGNAFSQPDGTYTYPTNPAYANNAADFVELRIRPLEHSTALRVTLNTLKDPSLVAVSIAIGGDPSVAHPFPYGANVRAPARFFLTVHPSNKHMVANLSRASDGTNVSGPSPAVTVDKVRRQIEVRVAHSEWNPGKNIVRFSAGAGLWDNAAGRYLLPQPAADASHPGGSGPAPSPPAFFNVAFRNDEPFPTIKDVFNTAVAASWWRDKQQGQQLQQGDISGLHADVNFRKLAAGTTDNGGVPHSGPIDRILASRFETAQGADFSAPCFPSNQSNCKGEYQSRLQPYALYLPKKSVPANGFGTTLLLHSLSTNYNQYLGSRNQSEFGERGEGSVVITPEARGPDGFYESYAGADVFEVWADVARHYKLDPDWNAITGYSMGGIGTFDLGEQFPDLFAKAQPTVGDSSSNPRVASLRTIPVLMWNVATDELVPPPSYLPTAEALDSNGYRYELDVFTPAEHNSLAINDEFAPAAAFLGTAEIHRNPAHVTFVVDKSTDHAKLGYVADHAYWLSNIRTRGAGQGTIDVLSHGFGAGDPTPSATQFGAGTLTGGTIPAIAFTRQFKTWGPVPKIRVANRLDITATNIGSITVDATRAHVGCSPKLTLNSDGPLSVKFVHCPKR